MHLLGRILGLNKKSDQGTILGKDENRYTFKKEEIEDEVTPEKNMCVEFDPSENKKATNIHKCETYLRENSSAITGIATILITLIFGCIGTFVSRHLLAKLSLKEVLTPTLIHFVLSLLFFIPIAGAVFYIITTLFFTVKNYKLVMQQ